jgi:hypothetical protein
MVSKTELGSTIFRMDCKSKCLRLNSSSQERHGYFPWLRESEDSDEDRWEESNANAFDGDMETRMMTKTM